MAARYFCDKCGDELTPDQHGRVRRALGDFAVEIMVRNHNVWNSGHVCHKCVVQVAVEGTPYDTSPQPMLSPTPD